MIVRTPNLNEASQIAKCLLPAIEDIFKEFLATTDHVKVLGVLTQLVSSQDSQYSYQNCLVAVVDNQIVGAVCFYDGADLLQLRLPVFNFIRQYFNPSFNPEDETSSGEIYIDSIGVLPSFRGKGIGGFLLNHLIEEKVHKQGKTLGLLVEQENEKAEILYHRFGFSRVGEKMLVGKVMHHLQIRPYSVL